MMEGTKAFHVAVIAELTEREWQTLAIAKRLTSTRPRSYDFAPPDNTRADIYLVDAEDAKALERWQQLHKATPAPTVHLVTTAPSSSDRREFRRPMMPSSLLPLVKVLDQVTVQELCYLPELCIGDNVITSPAAVGISAREKKFSALVVDDSPTVLAQVGLILNMLGIAADFAESAEKAQDFIERNHYDIAFLDVVLPGKVDGYQLCKAIKKNKHRLHTTVIMLTSKSSTIDRVRASFAGCDAFLTKPVETEVFQDTVRKHLYEKADLLPQRPASG